MNPDDKHAADNEPAKGSSVEDLIAYVESLGKRRCRLVESIFANPDTGTPFDDANYQQILDQGGVMDVDPAIQEKLQRLSLLLYRKNALAFGSIEVKNDFTVGAGVQVIAKDAKVQELLDEHWEENEWDEVLPERARSLAIFGELVLPAFLNKAEGKVMISSVSAMKIAKVRRDAENGEKIVGLDLRLGTSSAGSELAPGSTSGVDVQQKTVINRNPETGKLEGDVFFFPINRPNGANRGTPDLCASLDWMEGLDGLIFSMLERAELTQDIVYDVLYEGANDGEIKAKVKALGNALRSGGIFGHNEKVKLSIQTPNLAAQDAASIVGILKGQAFAGARLAGLFLGSGADLNRASAMELSIPVAKHFQARQKFIKGMLRKIFSLVIQVAKEAGRLAGVNDLRFDIKMPRIFLRDLSTIASAIQLLSIGLQLASQNAWITDAEAKNTFRSVLEDLGVDVAPSQIVDRKDVEEPKPPAGAPVPPSSPQIPSPEPDLGKGNGTDQLPSLGVTSEPSSKEVAP